MDKVVELRKDKEAVEREEAEAPAAPPARRRRFSGRLRIVLALVVLLVIGVVAWPWLAERWSHVAINDARIAANLVTVSSEVSGHVTSLPVLIGDRVTQGQVLAAIDTEQAELELEALDAQFKGVESQQDQLRAQQEMIRSQVAAKLSAGRTQVTAAEATHRASEAMLASSTSRFERISQLAESNVTSAQVLEEAQAALASAREEEKASAAAIETARANIEVVRTEAEQIAVLEGQIATLDAQKAELRAQRGQKQIDLGRREIRAGFDGVVDSTFIDPGEYVSPGTRLLIYHDPAEIWIDANVKETDFGRVKMGARATITVDAYPAMEFHGEVTQVGAAATSQFALLPSPNPSGNFTKITQRLPIRVSIDQQDALLRPGMMVEVSIDVVD